MDSNRRGDKEQRRNSKQAREQDQALSQPMDYHEFRAGEVPGTLRLLHLRQKIAATRRWGQTLGSGCADGLTHRGSNGSLGTRVLACCGVARHAFPVVSLIVHGWLLRRALASSRWWPRDTF